MVFKSNIVTVIYLCVFVSEGNGLNVITVAMLASGTNKEAMYRDCYSLICMIGKKLPP